MRSFRDKVAAITGAGSGIGRALAVALARRGCHLALSDVDLAGCEETARLAARPGVRITTARVDVADRAAVYAWADAVVRDHGRCNLVFNNAGVSYAATVEGAEYADLDWIVGINFWGVVHGTKAFLPHLRASGDGHIVNTSSVFGLMGFPGQAAYCATKFAVRGFTEALRLELEITGAPVSASSVHPGGVRTNIARAARQHASLRQLGLVDLEKGTEMVEKSFTMSPERAAAIILRGVRRDRRRIIVGADARAFDLMQRVWPGRYEGLVARTARQALKLAKLVKLA